MTCSHKVDQSMGPAVTPIQKEKLMSELGYMYVKRGQRIRRALKSVEIRNHGEGQRSFDGGLPVSLPGDVCSGGRTRYMYCFLGIPCGPCFACRDSSDCKVFRSQDGLILWSSLPVVCIWRIQERIRLSTLCVAARSSTRSRGRREGREGRRGRGRGGGGRRGRGRKRRVPGGLLGKARVKIHQRHDFDGLHIPPRGK